MRCCRVILLNAKSMEGGDVPQLVENLRFSFTPHPSLIGLVGLAELAELVEDIRLIGAKWWGHLPHTPLRGDILSPHPSHVNTLHDN